jgi:hypothetical protein
MLITQFFINALEYLIDSGRLKSVADFERITGFRQQRITGMKKFLSEESDIKGYFANTDHIAVMNEKFGVSLKYLIFGVKPIIEPKNEPSNLLAEPRGAYDNGRIQKIEEEVSLIRERQKILNDRFEIFIERFKN